MMLFTDIWGKGNILREYSVTGSGEHGAGERRPSRGLQAPRLVTCCGSETPSGLRTSVSSRSLRLRVGVTRLPPGGRSEAADTRWGGAGRP